MFLKRKRLSPTNAPNRNDIKQNKTKRDNQKIKRESEVFLISNEEVVNYF